MVLPKPTNLTTTSHTTTSITLNWEQVQGATQGYEIQHKTPDQTSWSAPITATSTETSKQINSLTSGTTYQIRIRALRTNTPDNIPSAVLQPQQPQQHQKLQPTQQPKTQLQLQPRYRGLLQQEILSPTK